jgi:hypothetical protein
MTTQTCWRTLLGPRNGTHFTPAYGWPSARATLLLVRPEACSLPPAPTALAVPACRRPPNRRRSARRRFLNRSGCWPASAPRMPPLWCRHPAGRPGCPVAQLVWAGPGFRHRKDGDLPVRHDTGSAPAPAPGPGLPGLAEEPGPAPADVGRQQGAGALLLLQMVSSRLPLHSTLR